MIKLENIHLCWGLFAFFCFLSTKALSQQGFLYATVADYGETFRIQAAVEPPRLIDTNTLNGISLRYALTQRGNDYLILQQDTFNLAKKKVERVNETFYFQFGLKAEIAAGLNITLVLHDSVTGKSIEQKLFIPDRSSSMGFDLYNLSQELRFNYNKTTDPLMFHSTDSAEVSLYRFKQNFKAAAPPMITNFSGGQQRMEVEEVLGRPPNTPFNLTQPGLYFAQLDTTTSKGIGISVVDQYFPKFSKVDQLADAIIYISTSEEVSNMQGAKEKKPVFDNFWLNAGGTTDNGSNLIKIYFRRVAFANRNFTAHKEGWKTDRGIIYIVYGRPDKIETLEGSERWIYTRLFRNQPIAFNFVKKPNIFTPNNYELVRDPAFKASWNEMVRRWRSGGIVR